MIQYNEQKNIWIIETDNTAYVLGISETNTINHIYFGERLPYPSDYPGGANEREWASFTGGEGRSKQEYMSWSGPKYSEPCLKATFHDHVREVDLRYKSYESKQNTLSILLEDVHYPLEVLLQYHVIEECDMIERTATISNKGVGAVELEQALTGSIYLPKAEAYRLTHLVGKWAGETQLQQTILPQAKTVIESRRGFTSHHANPWFAIDPDGKADEQQGKVFFGALAFSGNWKIAFEIDIFQLLKISAGVNDFDFGFHLKPGLSFTTPKFIVGFTDGGFGQASRNLHKYQLHYVLPQSHRQDLRKILYNSWEATFFDVNEEQQGRLAEIAASIGVELFVVDDGWFGTRNSDKAGLGDWVVNEEKFPQGLHGLIQKVNTLGMDFGLWVEPEMVNPDSHLYRQHPEWVYHFETRQRTELRNQLVLNVARDDVQEYIFTFMDRLLTEYNIKFIKWDLNRNISEPGYPSAEPKEQREIWVRHTWGIYDVVRRLRAKHPEVVFQSCSGGGGRVDLGILEYFDQVWTSDNTDAFDRLKIQEGFSYVYCAKTMEAWVTDEVNWVNKRNLSLKYRFHSSMTGNLGIGENLTKWSIEQREEAKQYISLYKEIRPIIQHGIQYRLSSPSKSCVSSVMYVNPQKTEAVVFGFLHFNQFANELPTIYLAGLEENDRYIVDGYPEPMSGKALHHIGIKLMLDGDFDSICLRIHKIIVQK